MSELIIRTIKQNPFEYIKLTIYFWSLVETFYYKNIDNVSTFITVVLGTDLFITRKIDIKLHHLITIIFYIYVNTNGMTPHDKFQISRPVMVCEVSSVFLSINNIYSKEMGPRNALINQLLFVTTFIYYRIYSYYVDCIVNKEYHNMVNKYNNFYWTVTIWSTVYVFYTLNLYWTFLIGKKIYRKIVYSEIAKDD